MLYLCFYPSHESILRRKKIIFLVSYSLFHSQSSSSSPLALLHTNNLSLHPSIFSNLLVFNSSFYFFIYAYRCKSCLLLHNWVWTSARRASWIYICLRWVTPSILRSDLQHSHTGWLRLQCSNLLQWTTEFGTLWWLNSKLLHLWNTF